MATKKKSPTSKKTTSKTKKSTTKKSVSSSAAASSKSKSKKVSTNDYKPAGVKITSVGKATDTLKKLNGWNGIMALLYIAAGAAIAVYSNTVTRAVTMNFQTEDVIASTPDNTVIVEATRTLFDINIANLVAAVLFTAGLMHLLVSTVLRKSYEKNLDEEINKHRWLGHGISDGLLVTTVGLLVGISNAATLLAIFVLVFVVISAITMANRHIREAHKTGKIHFVVAKLLVLTPWVIILGQLLSSNKYGQGDVPTYLYWLAGSTFVLFAGYIMVERARHKSKNFTSEYVNVEWAYMIIGFVLKAAFAGIIFNYLLK